MSKPFSQACEKNKEYILAVLKEYLRPSITVLEIGSGTAQHINYFSEIFPAITWIPSEIPQSIATLKSCLPNPLPLNLREPLTVDVIQPFWEAGKVSAVFSANTLHIMSSKHVEYFFQRVSDHLEEMGYLLVYGPFNYGGEYSSESNARFDQWLADRDSLSAIRNFEWVNALAETAGMTLVKDHEMPANNRILVWQKTQSI